MGFQLMEALQKTRQWWLMNRLSDPPMAFRGLGEDGASGNLNNFAATSILVIHATGSDGSTVTFHDVMHITVLTTTSPPTVVSSFDMPTCG